MTATLPRALVGPIWAMARPARPTAEIIAVREAAASVREETGLRAVQAVAREIAARAVTALMADIERDTHDTLAMALAAVEQSVLASPIIRLATCAEIDLASEFVERRVARLRSRAGRYLSGHQQKVEQSAIAADLEATLANRYSRHLRA